MTAKRTTRVTLSMCLWCGEGHDEPKEKCLLLGKRFRQAVDGGVPTWCMMGALSMFGQALLLEPENFNQRMELFAVRFGKKGNK